MVRFWIWSKVRKLFKVLRFLRVRWTQSFLNTLPKFFLRIKNGFTSCWRFVLGKNWIDRHKCTLKPHHSNKYQESPLVTRNMWNFLPNWVEWERFRSIWIIFIRGFHKMLVSRQIFLVNFISKWVYEEQPVGPPDFSILGYDLCRKRFWCTKTSIIINLTQFLIWRFDMKFTFQPPWC